MQNEITFDEAIEILEITSIDSLTVDAIPKVVKKAKIRWHPDRIAQYGDEQEIEKYTLNFQKIELAAEMVEAFLKGEYHAGEKFQTQSKHEPKAAADIIREEAPEIQKTLFSLWPIIKSNKFKFTQEEVVLSDGFNLKELLSLDFKEDLAGLSIISFIYGIFFCTVIGTILAFISPVLTGIVFVAWIFQAIACVLGFLPLSRFWLPDVVQEVMVSLINFGLGIYNWAYGESQGSSIWVQLLVQIPVLLSQAVKYLLLFPLVELTKAIIGERVVGVVKKQVDYYAGGASWYIEDLLKRSPDHMTEEELYDLSFLYGELSQAKTLV